VKPYPEHDMVKSLDIK